MLKKYDRYVLKKFLTTFFFILGVIMLLAMVFDISEKLKDFLSKNAPVSEIISIYYVNFFIYYGNMFTSLIVFITVIWFTSKMAQDSEIIPMLFSGKPFYRILYPYLLGALVITGFSLLLTHYLVPISNKSRLAFEDKYYRYGLHVSNFIAEFPDNTIVYYDRYDSEDSSVYNLHVEKWNENKQLEKYLQASSAKYNPAQSTWHLNNYFIRTISMNVNEKGETIPDILDQGIQKDTTFAFTMQDIARRDNNSEAMTYGQLKRFIRSEKQKGNPNYVMYEIELYQRTSLPFAAFILTLIGFTVSYQKKRGGIGLNIAIGLAFAFIYIFSMKVTTVAAMNVGFSPFLSVWAPNILFLIIGFVFYRLSPK